jgi:hypothetical protein
MAIKKKNKYQNADDFYNPFDAMSFTYDRCFLCGHPLENEKTNEHVFPKWIQQKYHLQNRRLFLLNRMEIPYRKLTIPCCPSCNTQYLSRVENVFKQYFEKGFSEFMGLNKLTIYQWMGKIFYGLLFKELSLLIEPSDPTQGFITNPELLQELRTLHTFLQSVRMPFDFVGFRPWSIFLVETHSYGDERDFDYHDEIFTLTFSIRLGDIGIIACLEDNGAQEDLFSDYFAKFKGIKLHPTQFDELVAHVTYKAHLMNRVPKYIMMLPRREGDKVMVMSPSLQGYSTSPIFNDWKQRDYAAHLYLQWSKYGIRFEDIFKEPDMVLSNLIDEDGTVKILDADGNLIKPEKHKRGDNQQATKKPRDG